MNGRVLLLRDEELDGIDVAPLLRGQGYGVVASADQKKACELLKRGPDLLLIEVGLLSAPGWEDLLANGRRLAIPSLLFSCRGQMHDLIQHSASCDGVLLQPDSVTELRARIAPLAGHRQRRLQLARAQRLLSERNREQEEELRSAAQIQRSLIPTRLPDIGNYRFAWCFEPYEKIGGDLFNVMQLDENTVMAYLFDVSGPFAEGEVAMQGGDRLYLYSDGVIEWPNQEGELFGEERFFQRLDDLRGAALDEACRQVYASVREFAGGGVQQDDLTLLGIEFLES